VTVTCRCGSSLTRADVEEVREVDDEEKGKKEVMIRTCRQRMGGFHESAKVCKEE
jgi:hypothetical protein